MSSQSQQDGLRYVLETGGDVELKDEDMTRNYDRIEFTPSGMVVCINKRGYQKDCYPREWVRSIHTNTSDEEENTEWW